MQYCCNDLYASGMMSSCTVLRDNKGIVLYNRAQFAYNCKTTWMLNLTFIAFVSFNNSFGHAVFSWTKQFIHFYTLSTEDDRKSPVNKYTRVRTLNYYTPFRRRRDVLFFPCVSFRLSFRLICLFVRDKFLFAFYISNY